MAFMVFDTETTGLNTAADSGNAFVYDIGYLILADDCKTVLDGRHYLIKQTWYNIPLFQSAYYREKRADYISLLKGRHCELVSFGEALRQMRKDIERYGIKAAYAYNCNFDEGVFAFNCNWFKKSNPLESLQVYDIWGYASNFISNTEEYQRLALAQGWKTESNNISGNAENVYRFITKDYDFVELHQGLPDAMIETSILYYCLLKGAKLETHYEVRKVIPNPDGTPFKIVVDGRSVAEGQYAKKFVKDNCYSFTTIKGD